MSPIPKHIGVNEEASTTPATPPAFNTPATVPSTILQRQVYGSFAIAPSVLASAMVGIQVETGVGTGVYQTITDSFAAAGAISGGRNRCRRSAW